MWETNQLALVVIVSYVSNGRMLVGGELDTLSVRRNWKEN